MFTGLAIAGVAAAGASAYAANEQAQAAEEGGRLVAGQGAQTRYDLSDWAGTGRSANSRVAQLLGIGSGISIDDPAYKSLYNQNVAALDKAHQEKYGMSIFDPRADAASRAQQLEQIKQRVMDHLGKDTGNRPDDFGSLTKKFTMADFQADPGYEFRIGEGNKGIDRLASATGSRFSGANLKAISRFNQDFASNEFLNAYNRDSADKTRTYNMLTGVSNTGENAAAQTGVSGANSAATQADLLTQAGNARGAGAVGVTNALTGTVSSGLRYYQGQQMIDSLNRR